MNITFKEGKMTENRIKILKTIKDLNEIDFRGVCNVGSLKMDIVEPGILFLLKNKLITPTGGGYFKVSDLGEDYLRSLPKK